jgi:hypothetical protein
LHRGLGNMRTLPQVPRLSAVRLFT